MMEQSWTAERLRRTYLEFFRQRGHTVIPSASLVPEHDPTVLFTTAGMHPLVPFLLGEPHPGGKRLVNVQRCFRTSDIDEVGDGSHLTFFEMLGNWSLGDYFKKEAIQWSWQFLTSPDWLALPPEKLSVSVFAGDADAERDEESADLWRSVGVPAERIFYFGKEKNWWGPAGETGPCGPDTEMFYDTGKACTLWPPGKCDPSCDCGRYVEIWNDVFMQYFKNADGSFSPLKQRNVDTGMGLERTLAILNGVENVFETGILKKMLSRLKKSSSIGHYNEKSARIVVDHIRSSVFLASDGIVPSNKDQGYVLRRLIRRVMREFYNLTGVGNDAVNALMSDVKEEYGDAYPNILNKWENIENVIENEMHKFIKAINAAEKRIEMLVKEIREGGVPIKAAGKAAFEIFQSHGVFPEMTFDILKKEQRFSIKKDDFDHEFERNRLEHQNKSRKGAEQKFHGGLADTHERTIRMHTATHLLHQALRDVLGSHVFQKGSNITQERLRFDFSHPDKLTPEQIAEVERIVNKNVAADLPVHFEFLTIPDARAAGAIGLFDDKYDEKVKVYFIGDYSREFCGGPHVEHTTQVGRVRILKEEAVGAGVRRIKAVVDDVVG